MYLPACSGGPAAARITAENYVDDGADPATAVDFEVRRSVSSSAGGGGAPAPQPFGNAWVSLLGGFQRAAGHGCGQYWTLGRLWTRMPARTVCSCDAAGGEVTAGMPSWQWRGFACRRRAQSFAEIASRRIAWHLRWYPPCGLCPAAGISKSPSTAGRGPRVEQPTALTSLLRRCACSP